jgi:hypothetical protein
VVFPFGGDLLLNRLPPWRPEVTLTGRDRSDAEYLLPLWNARRRALRATKDHTLDQMLSEIAQTALAAYVRSVKAKEEKALGLLFVHGTSEQQEAVRRLLGMTAPELTEGIVLEGIVDAQP